MSLRWRIGAALAGTAALVGVAAAGGAYVQTARQLRAGIDDSLVARASEVNGTAVRSPRGRPGPQGRGDDGCPTAGAFQPASAAQITANNSAVIVCIAGGPTLPRPASGAPPKVGQKLFATVFVGDVRYRMLTTGWNAGGTLQIARDLDEAEGVLSSLAMRLALLALAGIAVAGLLGLLIASRMIRPVVRLRDTAESIATSQDLTTPIPTDGRGEVASLAASFNTMVRALATSRQQQQRLITDASHEMRTPLTSLRSNLEFLEHFDRLDATDRHDVLEAVQLDVSELTHMLGQLVELSSDRSNDDEAEEPLQLGDLARDVTSRARRRSSREITVDDDHVTIIGRPQMLDRAISNLVGNAVKYSPSTSPITVTVRGGRLEVRDHGPGIANDDLPHVFERFYRSTKSRTEPGSGLGLAIVSQIVVRHGGTMSARNDPSGGAVVGFDIPLER